MNKINKINKIIMLERGLDITLLKEEEAKIDDYHSKLNEVWYAFPLKTPDGTNNPKFNQLLHSYDFKTNTMLSCKNTPILTEMPYMCHILENIEKTYGEVKLVRLMKLKANTEIPRHVDDISTSGLIRLHIPIITNPHVVAYINDEPPYHMEAGNIYYFPFHCYHRVVNDGIEDRVHLVVDVELADAVELAVEVELVEKDTVVE